MSDSSPKGAEASKPERKATGSPLLSTPIEICCEVLSCITDLNDLYNCIISCKAFYGAFKIAGPSALVDLIICRNHPLAVALLAARNGVETEDAESKDLEVATITYLDDLEKHILTAKGHWQLPRRPAGEIPSDIMNDYALVRKFCNKTGQSPEAVYALYIAQYVFPADGPEDRWEYAGAQNMRMMKSHPTRYLILLGGEISRGLAKLLAQLVGQLSRHICFDEFYMGTVGLFFSYPLPDCYTWIYEMGEEEFMEKWEELMEDGGSYGGSWPTSNFGINIREYAKDAKVRRKSYLEDRGLVGPRSASEDEENEANEDEEDED